MQEGQVDMNQSNHKHSHKNKGVSRARQCELLCISTQGLNKYLIRYLYVYEYADTDKVLWVRN